MRLHLALYLPSLMMSALSPSGAQEVTAARGPSTIELRPGLVITRSARIAARVYRLPADSVDSAVITIRGDNITLDFGGATMEGTPRGTDPDRARGVAILVDGGRNVRITNARIRGYKIGVLARRTRNLSLLDNDLSGNWKPRLYSVVEHESLVDWLSFHKNDADEWLRYGAAAYLSDVAGGEIRGNTVTQGMNGLMLVRTNGLRIWNNNFSFNSGVGIGLYRSSNDTIMHNQVDYNVRGYSEGFYRRGQDAADVLIYEQSSRNVVAYNSMTHGGDGLFLWAGQSTMDTGTGGANDNFVYRNDLSFAVANGIEATFSRNIFLSNYVEGSEYGLWGGYSFDSKIVANRFLNNRFGVAIEHGQNNLISTNAFVDDSTAIQLWADSITDSAWGYPKHRDTRSRNYRIENNGFAGARVAIRASNTSEITVSRNRFVSADTIAVLRDTVGYTFSGNIDFDSTDWSLKPPKDIQALAPLAMRNGFMPTHLDGSPAARPRSDIIVDEWGPYDWLTPKLWPIDSTRASPLRLRVLGPRGAWRVISQRGLTSISTSNGVVGDTISVTPKPDSSGDWEIRLEYQEPPIPATRRAPSVTRPPVEFGYRRFEPRVDWTARFYKWTDSTEDPRKNPDAFASLTRSAPILVSTVPRLDYEGYRALPGLPRENFALEATGAVDLAPGDYTLRAISDDGVRVWVDGALVIDNWKAHESAVDSVSLTGGHHELKVQYYQADGWYEVRVEIVRAVANSLR
ncbi:MAG: right-handed parallel beta-helix repeat-containing protein [Gemmatimonadaceae bacterium]